MLEIPSGLPALAGEMAVDYLKLMVSQEYLYAYMCIGFLGRIINDHGRNQHRNFIGFIKNFFIDLIINIANIGIAAVGYKALAILLMSIIEWGLRNKFREYDENQLSVYRNNKDWDSMLKIYSQRIALNDNPELMHRLRAELLVSLERETEAQRDLSYLISVDKDRWIEETFFPLQIANQKEWVDSERISGGQSYSEWVNTRRVHGLESRRIIYVERRVNEMGKVKQEKIYKILKDDYAWPYEQRGLWLMKQGNTREAFLDFCNAIKLNPESLRAYCGRALVLNQNKDYAKAEKDYSRIVSLYESDLKGADDVLREALEDVSLLIKQNPENPWFYKQRVILEVPRNKTAAIDDYSKLIELNTEVSESYHKKIKLLLSNPQRHRETIENLSALIKLEPHNGWAYETRAQLYHEVGEYEKVLQDYSHMIALKFNLSSAYRLRASLLIALDRENEAKADLAGIRKIDPQDTWAEKQEIFLAQKEKVMSLISAGKETEAIDQLSEIIKADGSNSWAVCQRGILYDKNGKHREAMEDYHKVFSRKEKEERANVLKQIRKTINELSELIKSTPENGLLYKNRALLNLWSDRKNINVVINDFSSMIALNTEVFWALRYKAQLLIEADRNNEAFDELSRLMNLETKTDSEWRDRQWAYQNKAELYEDVGENDKALEIYKEMLRLHMDRFGTTDRISNLLDKMGKHAEAKIYQLSKQIEGRPSDNIAFNARKERGPLYEQINDNENAFKDYAALIEAKVELPFAYRAKAQLLLKLGREEEAVENIKELLTLHPKDEWALKEKGRLWAKAYNQLGFFDKFITYPLARWSRQLPVEAPHFFYLTPEGEVATYKDVGELTTPFVGNKMCPNYQQFGIFKNQCPAAVSSGPTPAQVRPT